MNKFKERRKALVDALRSGKYKQGKFVLQRVIHPSQLNDLSETTSEFCCLGVACEVAKELGLEVTTKIDDNFICYDGFSTRLPKSVRDYYGFQDRAGIYHEEHKKQNSLIELNDTNKSFDYIANVIESEPEGLFIDETIQEESE